jgi:4-hydroxy-3-polyprenylbenzoate decarboxylase
VAVAGDKKRELLKELPSDFSLPNIFTGFKLAMPGVLAVQSPKYVNNEDTEKEVAILNNHLKDQDLNSLPLMVLCDDARFAAQNMNNLVWVTFTRSNPSHDIYGINSFTEHKHWGCKGPLIIDARIKPHHAPILEKDSEIEKRVDQLGVKGGELEGII